MKLITHAARLNLTILAGHLYDDLFFVDHSKTSKLKTAYLLSFTALPRQQLYKHFVLKLKHHCHKTDTFPKWCELKHHCCKIKTEMVCHTGVNSSPRQRHVESGSSPTLSAATRTPVNQSSAPVRLHVYDNIDNHNQQAAVFCDQPGYFVEVIDDSLWIGMYRYWIANPSTHCVPICGLCFALLFVGLSAARTAL